MNNTLFYLILVVLIVACGETHPTERLADSHSKKRSNEHVNCETSDSVELDPKNLLDSRNFDGDSTNNSFEKASVIEFLNDVFIDSSAKSMYANKTLGQVQAKISRFLSVDKKQWTKTPQHFIEATSYAEKMDENKFETGKRRGLKEIIQLHLQKQKSDELICTFEHPYEEQGLNEYFMEVRKITVIYQKVRRNAIEITLKTPATGYKYRQETIIRYAFLSGKWKCIYSSFVDRYVAMINSYDPILVEHNYVPAIRNTHWTIDESQRIVMKLP
jgi:hypothetical protein